MTRIACFPDSFHEVNGVAHTSRQFQAWASRTATPFLCVRAAPLSGANSGAGFRHSGSVTEIDLPRSRAGIKLERDLYFDPFFTRHRGLVLKTLREFQPDIIHITGPSDVGILGAWAAHTLRIPLAAGWHTNLHEYAGARAASMLGFLPAATRHRIARIAEAATLSAALRFYRLAKVLFAPNPQLTAMLAHATEKPCHLMTRGVDTALFSPARRTRLPNDGRFVLGYVGRISAEKNVMALARLAAELEQQKVPAEFIIIGHGLAEARLREAMPGAKFFGVLKGEALAEAYADMDLFVFPSETDTYGNVVLEAMASGTPAIVTPHGGPQYMVRDKYDGYVTDSIRMSENMHEYWFLTDTERQHMRDRARLSAVSHSWDKVFREVVSAYAEALAPPSCG